MTDHPSALAAAPCRPPWFESRLAAACWVLLAALAFSLVYASGKLADGAVPALQIVWIRYLSGFATVSGLAAAQNGGLRTCLAAPGKRWLHALRALCGIGGLGCAVYAATQMPLADAAALKLLQGVFVILLAVLLLRERVTAWQLVAACLCLGGAFIIVRGNSDGFDPAAMLDTGAAPLVAILAASLIACETILIKFLARTESALSMLFHVNGFAALFMTLPMLWIWTTLSPLQLGLLCLLGPMAIAGQLCNVRAYKLADAAWLAPFGYSAVVFAALIGWIAFGDVPGLATLAGAALIVFGGLLLLRR